MERLLCAGESDVTNPDDASNHFRYDKHVSEVGLDDRRFFVWRSLLSGLPQLLDQGHGFPLQSTLETSSSTGVDDLHELLIAEVEEGFELNTAVLKLAEGSLSLELGSLKVIDKGGVSKRGDGS
jgi:hypothetical protein